MGDVSALKPAFVAKDIYVWMSTNYLFDCDGRCLSDEQERHLFVLAVGRAVFFRAAIVA
jgi:hypothetical protein